MMYNFCVSDAQNTILPQPGGLKSSLDLFTTLHKSLDRRQETNDPNIMYSNNKNEIRLFICVWISFLSTDAQILNFSTDTDIRLYRVISLDSDADSLMAILTRMNPFLFLNYYFLIFWMLLFNKQVLLLNISGVSKNVIYTKHQVIFLSSFDGEDISAVSLLSAESEHCEKSSSFFDDTNYYPIYRLIINSFICFYKAIPFKSFNRSESTNAQIINRNNIS